ACVERAAVFARARTIVHRGGRAGGRFSKFTDRRRAGSTDGRRRSGGGGDADGERGCRGERGDGGGQGAQEDGARAGRQRRIHRDAERAAGRRGDDGGHGADGQQRAV